MIHRCKFVRNMLTSAEGKRLTEVYCKNPCSSVCVSVSPSFCLSVYFFICLSATEKSYDKICIGDPDHDPDQDFFHDVLFTTYS